MSNYFLTTSEGQQIPIEGLMIIGRGAQVEILLKDPEASRSHAAIWVSEGILSIRDEGSANGTFVNNVQIQQPVRLNPGDTVRIGNTLLTVHAVGVQPPPQPVPRPVAAPVPPPPYPATPTPPPVSSSAAEKRGIRPLYFAIGCGVLLVALLCLIGLGYIVTQTDLLVELNPSESTADEDYTIEDALSDEVTDERGEVMGYLGLPDAFTISSIIVDGVPVRFESWRYYGFGLRVDFVDGEVAWTIDIEPVPDGTILPAWYDPLAFEIGMSPEEVATIAAAASPAGARPEYIDISEGGPELIGAAALVGDQIMIGVDETGVVYVETIAMFPVEGGS